LQQLQPLNTETNHNDRLGPAGDSIDNNDLSFGLHDNLAMPRRKAYCCAAAAPSKKHLGGTLENEPRPGTPSRE
jgi:hypothetical protein